MEPLALNIADDNTLDEVKHYFRDATLTLLGSSTILHGEEFFLKINELLQPGKTDGATKSKGMKSKGAKVADVVDDACAGDDEKTFSDKAHRCHAFQCNCR